MKDHPTHKLDAYRDDKILVAFCKVCSAEGDFLAEVCPGRFISNHERLVDRVAEHK